MKKSFIFSMALILTGFFLFNSTLNAQLVNKRILGKWKAESVEQYPAPDTLTPSVKTAQDNDLQGKTTAAPQTSKQEKGKTGNERKTEQKDPAKVLELLKRLAINSTLTINPDLTFVLKTPKKEMTGTYKVKRKGKIILGKDKTTKETIKLKVVEVTENTLVVIENFPIGDLKISLRKINP